MDTFETCSDRTPLGDLTNTIISCPNILNTWVLIVFYTTIDIMFVQDGYELKKRFLIHLLTYKENQYDSNIPEVLQDYLRRYISLTNGRS